MTYLIVHRCSDRVFDVEGYDRTTELCKLMEYRAPGYYVLVTRPGSTRPGTDGIDIAGPFVRMANAQAAATEIARSLAVGVQAMSSSVTVSPLEG